LCGFSASTANNTSSGEYKKNRAQDTEA